MKTTIKNIIILILLTQLSTIAYGACNTCTDPGNDITKNGNSFTASSAQGYFWEVCEGTATIVGDAKTQTVSVNNGDSSYKIKVSIFNNGACEEACETVTIIEGCTDADACNYNPAATVDDGNCDFGNANCTDPCNEILGCTDSNACNFNPNACVDDASCSGPPSNFDCDGNCLIDVDCNGTCGGNATEDCNGVCEGSATIGTNCTDDNGNPGTYNGSCICEINDILGCIFSQACNYNPDATLYDGSCDLGNFDCADRCNEIFGCMDINACNYNPDACVDDNSCLPNPICNTDPCAGDIEMLDPTNPCNCIIDEPQILGCTDNEACNYNPIANCDDASCEFRTCCNLPNWAEVTPTNESGVLLGQAQINGIPADECDLVAAFDCMGNIVGSAQLTIDGGIAYINLPMYGNDIITQEDDGMDAGEYFRLQLFDASENTYYHYTIEGSIIEFLDWQNTNGSPIPAYSDIADVYNFMPTQICDQTINLNAGWNLISLDLSPEDDRISTVFGSLQSGNLQYVIGFEGGALIFNPNQPLPFNTLKSIKDGSGYYVRVQNNDTLNVSGVCIDEGFRKPFDSGWNLVAYIPDDPQPTVTYFADLISTGNLVYVTGLDNGTKLYNPAGPPFLNTLNTLKNGFGYWVKVTNAVGKTIQNQTNIFSFINGTSNLPKGEEVKVLNEEKQIVATLKVIEDNYLMTTPIYGDDLITPSFKEGLSKGKALYFSWNNQIADVSTTFKGDYGLEKVNLEFKLAAQNIKPEIKLHPNPTSGQFLIELDGLLVNKALSVNIFGLDGQLQQAVKKQTADNIAVDLSGLPNGVYMVQLLGDDFAATQKLIKH